MIEKEYPIKLYTDEYDGNKCIVEHENYILAKGGDGTLLRAIYLYSSLNKPFYGQASGTINFLMNKEVAPIEKPKFKTFHKIKSKISYIDSEGFKKETVYEAFNDIMIGGDMNSWISFNVKDEDRIIGKFRGGGLIISTSQGSTGINKNNNGVILPLSSKMWSITGDKTNRKINYILSPKITTIYTDSRTSVNVWIDGQNKIITNVYKVELSKGSSVQLIFNEYSNFKKKRKLA